ncbi:MAG TPA: protein kinase, partial [Pirellulaceae bacterium]|nr:protein kinase [Pirellulaceae bacterium]
MNDTHRCPACHEPIAADAPAGLCPRCLYQAALASEPPAGESTSPGATGRAQPLPIERIAQAFPQLDALELLGQGGMGAVYKARQRALDRWVAIKILLPELAADADFVERFMREARTLARLGNHPHIVTIYDIGQADGLLYVSMEYVDGVNLRAAMREQRLAAPAALAIVGQICDALQFAHDHGVVHRDIKPENILLDRRGAVKIADFGLAKLMAEDVAQQSLTRTHQVLGTPRYMAPEQMEGSQQVDHRADIYSLGVVFYEILTGEVPLGNFPPPSKKATIDARLDDVVLRALHRAPEDRYQHASDVKSDVETIRAQVPPPGKPPLTPPVNTSRLSSSALAVVLIVLLTCGGSVVLLGVLGLGAFWLMPVHDTTILPDVNVAPPISTMSSFAKAGNLDQVQRLLNAGEDPNQLDANGYTPLIMAAIGGHSQVAKTLLNAGAELEQRSLTGTTALMEAAFA